MTDYLNIEDRIRIALDLGESHFREFKSALHGDPHAKVARPVKEVCVDIAQTLVAFANADGGELLVGVEDDGTASGLQYSDAEVKCLIESCHTHVHKDTPLPLPRALKVTFHGLPLLYFSIAKGTQYVHLTSEGRCLQRRDRESVPISSEAIQFSRREIESREYDRAFVEVASMADLDSGLIAKVAEHISRGMSPEKCLQQLELAEFDGRRWLLRRAALLLFARKPYKWHPRLQVRVLRIDGVTMKTGEEYNVVADQEASDNILNLVESSWELIRPHLTETRFSKEAKFMSHIMYPEAACRETLVNAIAHRDYSVEGRGIEVRVYTDRLEIQNPGGLLSSVNIDDLRKLTGVHQSRNSLVARVLRETGFMRELGEGMRRIFDAMKRSEFTPPELASDKETFAVTLHHKYVYTREQKVWLDTFADFELSREQRTIVLLGYKNHEISPQEIWDEVGIVDTDYYRQLLESLREKGILIRTRSSSGSQLYSQRRGVPKKAVPQFRIQIPQARPHARASMADVDASEYVSIYVGNIPYTATIGDISSLFGRFGSIAGVWIPKDRISGLPRGYAFVEFENREDAQKALGSNESLNMGGRELVIRNAFAQLKH